MSHAFRMRFVARYQAKLSILELWSGAVNQLQRKLLRELTLLRVEVSEPMQRLSEVRGLFEAEHIIMTHIRLYHDIML